MVTETFSTVVKLARVSCVWSFFFKQNQDAFQQFTSIVKCPVSFCVRLIHWNLAMLENSVIQQHHFIILSFDESCKAGLSNNVIF